MEKIVLLQSIVILIYFNTNLVFGRKTIPCNDYVKHNPLRACSNDGNYIFTVQKKETTFENALDMCIERGSHLASVQSREHLGLMADLASKNGYSGQDELLIGIRRDNNDAYHTDLTCIAFGTIVHQPSKDDRVGTVKPDDGDESWLDRTDLQVGNEKPSICKSLYDGYNEFFISIKVTRDFAEAKSKCKYDHGGKLKNIQDYNSQSLVQHNLQLRKDGAGAIDDTMYWIGMTYDKDTKKWKWPEDASYSVYRKWCGGQPMLFDKTNPETSCVATSGATGCWEVIDCATPNLRYMCDLPNPLNCTDDKHSLNELYQVALKEIGSAKKNCDSCRKH